MSKGPWKNKSPDRTAHMVGLPRMWAYRCFYLRPRKRNDRLTWVAANVFPMLAADVPVSFVWTTFADKDGLRQYIDALVMSRRSESIRFEHDGFAEDVEMPSIDRPNSSTIKVNVHRFMDFLALRDSFDVPLWGKVHFITDGQMVVPREYLGAVSQLFDSAMKKFIDPSSKAWHHCTERDLDKMGLRPEDIHTGMYRARYQNGAVDGGADDAEATVGTDMVDTETGPVDETPTPQTHRVPLQTGSVTREISINNQRHERYADVLTLVQPKKGPAYYARRLMTYGGRLLWAGSSYQQDGPWHVSHRDPALLLSLKIDEP